MARMKAALLEGIETIAVRETEVPAPGDHEALLKVETCTVCGSDLKIFTHGNRRVQYPTIVGHEVSGTIVEVGSQVRELAPGVRVAIGADVPGVWNTNVPGKDEHVDYATGHEFPGGFAEYMLLNEWMLRYGPVTRIPDTLSFDAAALAEPLACAVKGLEMAQFSAGKSVCIIGLGPIGIMLLEVVTHLGASRVFGVQRSRPRLELARSFVPGARYIATGEEDLRQVIADETLGRGVDIVITSAGSVKSHEDAIHIVAPGGYVNLFGGLRGEPELCIDSNLIHYKECFVMGSHGSHPRHHKLAVQFLDQGIVHGDDYISKRFDLDDIENAYRFHASREGLKAAVKPQGLERGV
ncbi:MAG: alcohol dehydrogenase catalytic domain-containing protein [Spirochaetota bacterium]